MSPFEWREAPPGDFAVLGDPVAHSLSPRMHAAAFAELGLPLVYRAVRVPLEEFEAALERLTGLGYRGVNATVPLKEAAFATSTGGDPRMAAVNTLRLSRDQPPAATNTDAPGFMETLVGLGVGPCPVLVLGAGGAARALVVALSDAGFKVRLWNRTPERAVALVAATGSRVSVVGTPDPDGCGLVLNTTSAGHAGAAPPCRWEAAPPACLAYDLTYGPKPTPFLAEAAREGVRGVDGKAMLVAQGALSLEFWLGIEAPRAAMMRAVS